MVGGTPRKRPRGNDITEEIFGDNGNGRSGSYLKISLASDKPIRSKGWPWVQAGLRRVLGKERLAKASFLRDGSLLVKTKDEAQTDKLIAVDHLLGEKCEVIRDAKLNTSQGIIRSYDLLDLPEDDIVHWLSEFGVVKAHRFTKKVGEVYHPTPSVLLTFDMPSCPDQLKLDYVIYRVEKYIPNPLQCRNCGQFGHSEKACTILKRCLDCGEQAHEGSCDRKCLSCGDTGHTCLSRDCARWKKEKEICRLKVEHEVSYFEARRQYEESHQPPPLLQPYSDVVRMPTVSQGRDDQDLREKVERLERKIDELTPLIARLSKIDEIAALLTKMTGNTSSPPEPSTAHQSPLDKTGPSTSGPRVTSESTQPADMRQVSESETHTAPTENPEKKKYLFKAVKAKKAKAIPGKNVGLHSEMPHDDDMTDDSDMSSQVIARKSRSVERKAAGSIPHRQSWHDPA